MALALFLNPGADLGASLALAQRGTRSATTASG